MLSPLRLLTYAGGQRCQVDEPEEHKAALQLEGPEHDVGKDWREGGAAAGYAAVSLAAALGHPLSAALARRGCSGMPMHVGSGAPAHLLS